MFSLHPSRAQDTQIVNIRQDYNGNNIILQYIPTRQETFFPTTCSIIQTPNKLHLIFEKKPYNSVQLNIYLKASELLKWLAV